MKIETTPAIVDLDKDGFKEIIVAGWNGAVWAFKNTGNDYIDSTFVTDPIYVIDDYDGTGSFCKIWGSPVVADINLDGYQDIIIASRTEQKIYIFDKDGNNLPGWPISTGYNIIATITVANIDSDPHPEIIVLREHYGLMIYNHDGSPYMGETALFDSMPESRPFGYSVGISSPAVGDLNGDGIKEIVTGGGNSTSGFIHCISSDGSIPPGFPFVIDTSGCYFNSSPALGNMDDDTSTLEIIINAPNYGVFVLNHLGEVLPGFPYYVLGNSSVAIADVDGDGKCEIFLVGSTGLCLIDDDGSIMPGWPVSVYSASYSSPSIADINGDGRPNLLAAVGSEIFAFNTDATLVNGFPLVSGNETRGTPTIDDIDGDGRLEIIYASYDSYVYVWQTQSETGIIPWQTFAGNYQRTGNVYDVSESISESFERYTPDQLRLYASPNPFNSVCEIYISKASFLEISDINGRLVESHYIENPSGSLYTFKPNPSLSSGVYLVRAKSMDKVEQIKIFYIK
jgi:hypothetical protein